MMTQPAMGSQQLVFGVHQRHLGKFGKLNTGKCLEETKLTQDRAGWTKEAGTNINVLDHLWIPQDLTMLWVYGYHRKFGKLVSLHCDPCTSLSILKTIKHKFAWCFAPVPIHFFTMNHEQSVSVGSWWWHSSFPLVKTVCHLLTTVTLLRGHWGPETLRDLLMTTQPQKITIYVTRQPCTQRHKSLPFEITFALSLFCPCLRN